MKRTLLEMLGLGAVVLLLGGVHLDVTALRSSDARKSKELARLQAKLEGKSSETDRRISDRVSNQSRELTGLATDLAKVSGELQRIRSEFLENSKLVNRQVTNAIGRNKALSKAVESAQNSIQKERSSSVRRVQELEQKLFSYQARFNELRQKVSRNSPSMTSEMLGPTVQLSGDETVGSGTVIASLPHKDGGFETFVLTANHVVRNILADSPRLKKEGITVTIYKGRKETHRKCDVVCRNPQHDLALVKLRGTKRVHAVAKLVAQDRVDKLELWTPIYAVGCPLGNDPIPTGGFLSSLENTVRGTKYWMINAPTYYGNSGGGIFDGDSHELIAVFSKIYTHGSTRPVVIPHMGLAVPMSLVYSWLEKEGHAYLIRRSAELASPK